jgi:hypothetical protein
VETWHYVVALIDAIEQANVPYMVVGSLSANVYGITRSTKDADFVLELGHRSMSEVTSLLGPEFRLERQLSFETNTSTVRQKLTVGENGFLIEIFRLSNDAHDQERFQRRRTSRVPQLNRDVVVPTPEDVIITKLRWILGAGRSKDVDDVEVVVGVQWHTLDWPYIHRWAELHGTRQTLDEICARIPKL